MVHKLNKSIFKKKTIRLCSLENDMHLKIHAGIVKILRHLAIL